MPPRRPVLLAVVCASIFFDALDLSITQVALPSIQRDLQVGLAVLPWVAAAYVVTYGGVLLLGGRLTDVLGARRVLLTGLAVFGAASLACGIAPSPAWLLTARAVQGVGAALTVPAAVAVLAGSFAEGPARTRAFAAFAVAAASGFSAGLVLGGVLTDGLSWRWIFLAKVPVVVLVLVTAAVVVPRWTPAGRRALDLTGAGALTGVSVLVVLGVTLAGTPAATAVTVGVPLAAAALLLAVFLLAERRRRDPLLPPRLLRRRRAMASDVAALTVLAAPFGVSYLVTVYQQEVLGRSPWATALVLLPGAVLSAAVGQVLAARLLERHGLPVVYPAALVVVAVGNAVLFALSPATATWVTVLATVVSFGLGMGVAYPAATLGGLDGVDASDHGAAAGLNNTALQVGGGLGLAVVAALVAGALGGSTVGAPPDVALSAIRLGVLGVVALPLLGAVVAAVGLRTPAPDRLGEDSVA
ncbi:MFS transporter [Actinomycetospora sp. NBRC 106375]|uniref:MFS transporter n=1 Tax=Actinomycetospora sp. NBRC 106375 TaxID=3032207 RepID=UPI0024A30AB1|nr:MFS transporter [Actinomycetospora sp. NBRC 106375]GLZ45232.1 MFS transporter [Actinomycetospora sp. NBRC 106375]